MSDSNLSVSSQAVNLAVDAIRLRQNLVWMGMAIIALLSVPGGVSSTTSGWLVMAALLGAVMLTNLYQARLLEDPRHSLIHLGVTFGSGLAAVVISMVLRPISGMFLLIVLGLLAVTSEKRPFVTAALSVILVPWWIWLAADSWRWQLLLLIPLIGLGLMAVSHILDTHAWPEGEERILSERAHRSAAWLLIALSGLTLVVVGLMFGVNRALLALGGIVLAAAIPLEAGVGTDSGGTARPGLRIVTGAYLIAATCLLVGIE